MSILDDPAPPLDRPTFRVDFAPPGRMSAVARWRCAARLARREVRRRPGRTLLVVALVAVPVLAMTLGVVLARTNAAADADHQHRHLGGVADIRFSTWGDGPFAVGPTPGPTGSGEEAPPASSLADLVPEGSRIVTYTEVYTTIVTADLRGPVAGATVSDLPLGDPLVGDQVELRSGRIPEGPGEVLLTRSLADDLDVEVGDTLDLSHPEGSSRVVGIGRRPTDWRASELVFGAFDWARADPAETNSVSLVDLPPGAGASDLGPLWEMGLGYEVADPALLPFDEQLPAEFDPVVLVWGWVAGALALVVVGIVVAAAFATSARRQLVVVGQLTAQGAHRSLVASTLALQGTWSGLLGALAGVGGALGLLVLGRPLAEGLVGRSLGPYAIRPSDITIILVTGTVAGTVAALVPARSAARLPVLSTLAGRRPLGQVPRWLVPVGVALFAGGLGLLAVAVSMGEARTTQTDLLAAVAVLGGLGVVFGMCCASPLAIDAAGRAGGRLRGVWRLAARSLGRQRTRSAGVVTAIAVSGAVALLAVTVVATAAEGRYEYRDSDEPLYALPSYPPDLVGISWPYEPVGAGVDRPVPEELQADLEVLVPGGELIPRRVAVVPAEAGGAGGEVPGVAGSPSSGELVEGGATTLVVADPIVLASVGLSDRDRAVLEGGGLLVLRRPWVGPTPFYSPGIGGPALERAEEEITLPGLPVAVPLLQDLPRTQVEVGEVLVTPEEAERLGLALVVDGGWWQAPAPLTSEQEAGLSRLEQRQYAWPTFDRASSPESDAEGPRISWAREYDDTWVSPEAVQAVVVAAALLFTLLVMAIGLSLSATESRDERDVLVAVGARPRTLRRMAGVKAVLLTATAMVLALPTGLLPALVVIPRVADRSLVVPVPALALLLVGVPVVAGLAAWGTSAVASRLRPTSMSTFAID